MNSNKQIIYLKKIARIYTKVLDRLNIFKEEVRKPLIEELHNTIGKEGRLLHELEDGSCIIYDFDIDPTYGLCVGIKKQNKKQNKKESMVHHFELAKKYHEYHQRNREINNFVSKIEMKFKDAFIDYLNTAFTPDESVFDNSPIKRFAIEGYIYTFMLKPYGSWFSWKSVDFHVKQPSIIEL
jgi:hypothetical protein